MRLLRKAITFAPLVFALCGQDAPRSKPSDYPEHVTIPSLEIGAEYLVHSIPGPNGGYFAQDYLVVEVAISPASRSGLKISSRQFSLRINNKSTLATEASGAVAASIKYPDWEQQRNMAVQAGPLIFGAPPAVGRFPGDPGQAQPLPAPQIPDQTNSVDKPADLPIESAMANAALPEGFISETIKGCLFFHFKGKLKSIKSLDLIYGAGENGANATIRLLGPPPNRSTSPPA